MIIAKLYILFAENLLTICIVLTLQHFYKIQNFVGINLQKCLISNISIPSADQLIYTFNLQVVRYFSKIKCLSEIQRLKQPIKEADRIEYLKCVFKV